MFTFIHTADIHLDSPLLKIANYEGTPVKALRNATRRAFENLINLALSSRVDFILISGDLYDGDWRDYNTGLFFVSQITRLKEAGIPVYVISGNHDAAGKMTKALRLPDNLHLFPDDNPATFFIDSLQVAIHGQGFSSPAVKKDLSAGYPAPVAGYFNIGMLHTGATGREGHEPYAPCSIEGLRSKGYDYWALGHIHQREILSDDPLIIFPGNIQGRHIRETGQKGCMIVNVDDDKQANDLFYPLDVIRWVLSVTDISDAQDAYNALDMIRESLENLMEENENIPLVSRIELTGDSEAYNTIASDSVRWLNEIRSLSLDLSGGSLCIEKLKLSGKTRTSNVKSAKTISYEGPVGEIISFFDDLKSDPAQLQALGENLNDLFKKIPRELRENYDINSDTDILFIPEKNNSGKNWLPDMLEHQVKPMLLHRLK